MEQDKVQLTGQTNSDSEILRPLFTIAKFCAYDSIALTGPAVIGAAFDSP